MDRKIALLTFHDTTNFGALLQTFGLYKKLNDMGCDCSVLNYQCANIVKREIPEPFRFSLNPKALAVEILVKSKARRRYTGIRQFMSRNIPKMTQPYNRESLFSIKEEFDSFVVGSDMLWGLDITDSDFSFFLDFVPEGICKFSYATSIGKREWNSDETEIIVTLLNRFAAVSVREEVTKDILTPLLLKPCQLVCDPTMLLTTKEWHNYVSNRYSKGGFVLAYFNTEDGKAFKDAEAYANSHGKKLFVISDAPSFLTSTHNVSPSAVEDFLSLIYFADTVFTASYHGLLFSLYFHKDFVYYNRQPACRMETVAKRIGLEFREGRSVDFDNLPPLDFETIDKRMAEYRTHSIDFIRQALK